MKTWHWFSLAALVLSVAVAGCGSATSAKKDAAVKVYDIKGKVTAINQDDMEVTLDHEDIPGLMSAMVMPFKVAYPTVLQGIQVGDKVEGKLEKRDTGNVIIKLEKH
ncbi:MAG TPA: copper-binding protein [Gemmataceae bacterium]